MKLIDDARKVVGRIGPVVITRGNWQTGEMETTVINEPMNDRERLTLIVAQAIEDSHGAWTWADWIGGLPEDDKARFRVMAETIIKTLQVHGYLNSRGYPPDELKKYGVKP